MKKTARRFFSRYSRSSAAVFTLVLHAVLITGGLSLVVMRQVIRDVPVFEGHQIRRSRPLPPLRPPVSAHKPQRMKPRMERIPVEVNYTQQMPEFALPELPGIKGDFAGAGGTAAEGLEALAFSMPELGLFNVRTRGEKIFLILDAGADMLEDEMGGIAAYTIIKEEMLRMVDGLPPTAVFNICVFGNGRCMTRFPGLVKATGSNVRKVAEWLRPLNAVDESVATGRYGLQTLGDGGIELRADLRAGRFAEGVTGHEYRPERWFRPAMLAMQQGADTVFLLTNWWGHQRVISGDGNRTAEQWYESSAGRRWVRHVEEAKELLAEENRKRKADGKPPRVIAHGAWGLMRAYFPDTQHPPVPDFYYFTPDDFQQAFLLVRASHRSVEIGLKMKDRFSFNVIHFMPADTGQDRDERFLKLTKMSRGGYQTMAGLEAIESYVKGARK